jgi:orotidine-5'-phosphate decarboxylase
MTFKISLGLDLDYNEKLQKYFNIIDETKDLAFFYKINPAFFLNDRRKIKSVCDYIKLNDCKFIYDGKLGDVTHANVKYAEYVYDYLNADGVTLNPYLGKESLKPFSIYKNKMNFVLCRTTNIKSELIQNKTYKLVYEIVNNLKFDIIMSSNKKGYIEDAIKNCKDSLILSSGIGLQGGKLSNANKDKVIYSVSRSIINSEDPREELIDYVYS